MPPPGGRGDDDSPPPPPLPPRTTSAAAAAAAAFSMNRSGGNGSPSSSSPVPGTSSGSGGGGGGEKKWSCDFCTYENWNSAVRCTMCRTPRAPRVIRSGAPPPSQQLTADIFHLGQPCNNNNNVADAASLKHQRRSASPSVSGEAAAVQQPGAAAADEHIICDHQSQAPKWSCVMCTYLNWPRSLKCVQCQAPRKPAAAAAGGVGAAAGIQQGSGVGRRHQRNPGSSTPSPRSSPPGSLSYHQANQAMDGIRISGGSRNNSNSEAAASDWNAEANRRNTASPANSAAVGGAGCSSSGIAIDSSVAVAAAAGLSTSPSSNSCSGGGGKWSCSVCTYDNWPRSKTCVLCGTRQPPAISDHRNHQIRASNRDSPSPPAAAAASLSPDNNQLLHQQQQQRHRSFSPAAASSSSSCSAEGAAAASNNNYDYERRLRQLRRRMRESDWTWLTACMGVVEGDANPVEAYLSGGGDPTRKLTNPEVALLNRAGIYEAGHTLVHLAIRFHREDILATLLSQLESGGPTASGGVKCVPSYVAPDLASAIRRHIAQSLRQRKGSPPFPCHYLAEWATYSLPPEIGDLPPATQEQLNTELLDKDALKELEDGGNVNWSEEVRKRLGSRLSALWNRSAGDCLLDSVLQATWSVFDRDNTLRKAMSDSLHEAGHLFFPRWKEWETRQALELDFTLHESQLAEEWAALLQLASQPGSSLEQLHIFCLAHVLRRPIVVYGVKYVKSWRGENLGYARFEGVYLPLLWEPSFCCRSPIALGYTRGHFSALVAPEPASASASSVGGAASASAASAASAAEAGRAAYLPLVTAEDQLLPVHFLSRSEQGREQEILREWLDVGMTDGGVLVAKQAVAKPPLLVAQLTEEWLNHYRKLAQSWTAPFSSRAAAAASAPPSSSPGGGLGCCSGCSNTATTSKAAQQLHQQPLCREPSYSSAAAAALRAEANSPGNGGEISKGACGSSSATPPTARSSLSSKKSSAAAAKEAAALLPLCPPNSAAAAAIVPLPKSAASAAAAAATTTPPLRRFSPLLQPQQLPPPPRKHNSSVGDGAPVTVVGGGIGGGYQGYSSDGDSDEE